MKKILFGISFLLLFAFSSAQMGYSNPVDDTWRVGGGLGIGFGNDGYLNLAVAPFVGYMVTPQLEGGMTVGLDYAKNNTVKRTLFSFGPYANYYVANSFFGRAHYEYFTGTAKSDYYADSKINEAALWLGVGYQSSGTIRFQTGLMYNVLYDDEKSNLFRTGFRPFGGVSISL